MQHIVLHVLSERTNCRGGGEEEGNRLSEKMCLNAAMVEGGGTRYDDGIPSPRGEITELWVKAGQVETRSKLRA
jgi:hypothetical protein